MHMLCSQIIRNNNTFEWREIIKQENWIKNKQHQFPIIEKFGVDFIADEIQ